MTDVMTSSRQRERLATFGAVLDERGLDAAVIYGDGGAESGAYIRYLTGWMPLGSDAVLVVRPNGGATVLSDDKNRARAMRIWLDAHEPAGVDVIKTKNLPAALDAHLGPAALTLGTVGMGELRPARAAALAPALAAHSRTPIDAALAELRSHRGDYEAQMHREAVAVSDAMVAHAMRAAAEPGMSGARLMAEVENVGRSMGADRAGCWLAIGRVPAETYFDLFELAPTIEPEDRVQIGTTVLHQGYFSQVLRIGTAGTPDAALSQMAERLIRLQDAALAAMVPGAPIHHIGDVLEQGIDELSPFARADDPFRFQSCHAMGNSYSEPWSAPFLNADRDRSRDGDSPLVEAGQVYEIHPNFTSDGLGHVCAGDTALVTAEGGTWLSQTPRGILRLGTQS